MSLRNTMIAVVVVMLPAYVLVHLFGSDEMRAWQHLSNWLLPIGAAVISLSLLIIGRILSKQDPVWQQTVGWIFVAALLLGTIGGTVWYIDGRIGACLEKGGTISMVAYGSIPPEQRGFCIGNNRCTDMVAVCLDGEGKILMWI